VGCDTIEESEIFGRGVCPVSNIDGCSRFDDHIGRIGADSEFPDDGGVGISVELNGHDTASERRLNLRH